MGQEQVEAHPQVVKIFSCYDNHDRRLYEELENHLSALRHLTAIEIWTPRQIRAGEDRPLVIKNHLEESVVILLLISNAFLNNPECREIQKQAMERYNDGSRVRVIPVLLGPIVEMPQDLARLQALPRNGKPIPAPAIQRQATLAEITKEIYTIIKEMQQAPQLPPLQLPPPPISISISSSRPRVLMLIIMLSLTLIVGVSLLIGFAKNFNATDTQKTPTSSPTSIAHPVPAWTTTITTGATGVNRDSHVSSPVVVDGTVYVGSYDGSLYAFNANTGKKLWASPSTGNFITSTPVVVNGIVYVGSWDHKLHAFDATTGAIRWTSMPAGNSIFSSPVVDNGTVYVGSQDDKLYAFNAATGATRWISSPTGDSIESSPAVADGVVYVGSWDHKLYAFDAGSGKLLWFSAPTGNMIKSSPAVANGVVYVGSDDGKLYAYKVGGCGSGQSSCLPLWSSTPTMRISSSPAVVNGTVYVGSDDGKLYAYQAGGCGSGQSSCPPLWTSVHVDGAFYTSPKVANGLVYISLNNGTLYVYNAAGCSAGSVCQPVSTITVGEHILSSPAIANGEIYVASQDGKLYAFHAR